MHAYPAQLAEFVLDNWPADAPLELSRRGIGELLSTAYQASLTQEEGRAVRFRAVIADAKRLCRSDGSSCWLSLRFDEPLPFTADEARRISPAAPFESAALGLELQGTQTSVWGLIQTGTDWLTPQWGGRPDGLESRSYPIIQVMAPGRLVVYCGSQLVASLERGSIEATTTDVFTSRWLPRLFDGARSEVQRLAQREAPENIELGESLIGRISQHMIRRAIYLIRAAGHGGLLLFADKRFIQQTAAGGHGPILFKYPISAASDRDRYRSLLRGLLRQLGHEAQEHPVDWQQFLTTKNPKLEAIEQSVFEFSRLIAGLSGVDGAVMLDKRFELMGFGAEISGRLPYPHTVYQALEVEGERTSPEPATAVGTRHRAAYRFVAACPEGLAIVISHDGEVRFIASLEGKVVYWDQFLNW